MSLGLLPPPMKPTESRPSRGRRVARWLPVDLLAVVAALLLVDAFVLAVGPVRPIADPPLLVRIVVGFPVLFFVPGYALLAALFPGEPADRSAADTRLVPIRDGLAFPTRLALSFGVSVAALPVVAVALAFSPWGFGTESLLGLLTVVVLVVGTIGAVRRSRLPPADRFEVPATRWASDLVGFVTDARGPVAVGVHLLLVASVVLAASGLAYAMFVPPADPPFVDFMLLTESGDGDYVSSGYPTNFTRGSAGSVVVGIANHRGERTRYSVVVELQRVDATGSDVRVLERSELDRFGVTVGPDETWYGPRRVVPDLVGEDLRLAFYLYRGDAPAEPARRTAEEHLHLWIDVSP